MHRKLTSVRGCVSIDFAVIPVIIQKVIGNIGEYIPTAIIVRDDLADLEGTPVCADIDVLTSKHD